MSDLSLFDGVSPTRLPPAGHYGLPGDAGVSALLRDDLALATLHARKGAGPALAAAALAAFGAVLPEGPRVGHGAGIDFIGTGPGRWLAVSASHPNLAGELAAALGAHAAITEQSDSSLVIDLSGPRVRETLAKGVAIDLHPTIFRPGDAATTSVALVGVTLLQLDAAPAYRFIVGRSVAVGFARFLAASGAEYGFRLDHTTGRG